MNAPPALSRSSRRRAVRAQTLNMQRLPRRDRFAASQLFPEAELRELDARRPRTRSDCAEGMRPCPYVACKHHLYLDVSEATGSIKMNFPDLRPEELTHSCALDLAAVGGMTLEDVAAAMNVTRERVRQMERRAMLHVKRRHLPLLDDMLEGHGPSVGVDRLGRARGRDDKESGFRLVQGEAVPRVSAPEPEIEEEAAPLIGETPHLAAIPAAPWRPGESVLGELGAVNVDEEHPVARGYVDRIWRIYIRESAEIGHVREGERIETSSGVDRRGRRVLRVVKFNAQSRDAGAQDCQTPSGEGDAGATAAPVDPSEGTEGTPSLRPGVSASPGSQSEQEEGRMQGVSERVREALLHEPGLEIRGIVEATGGVDSVIRSTVTRLWKQGLITREIPTGRQRGWLYSWVDGRELPGTGKIAGDRVIQRVRKPSKSIDEQLQERLEWLEARKADLLAQVEKLDHEAERIRAAMSALGAA